MLLMFSGGLDSTYLAWKTLQEGKRITLYHIILKNRINRWKEEQDAQLKIVEQFQDQFSGQVTYVESILDVSSMKVVLDAEYYIPLGTTYALSYNFNKITVGFLKDDNTPNQNDYQKITQTISKGKVTLDTPLINLTKEDFINQLPEKYKTFSCRSPIKGESCGRCLSCKKINNIKRGND